MRKVKNYTLEKAQAKISTAKRIIGSLTLLHVARRIYGASACYGDNFPVFSRA